MTIRKNNILAIDASNKSLRLLCYKRKAGRRFKGKGDNSLFGHRVLHGRSQDAGLFAALDAMGIGYADISALGLVAGPGSYTGLRLAFSFASALAFDNPGLGVYSASVFSLMARGSARAAELIFAPSLRQDFFCHMAAKGGLALDAHCCDGKEALRLMQQHKIAKISGPDAARWLAQQDTRYTQEPQGGLKPCFTLVRYSPSLPIILLMRALLASIESDADTANPSADISPSLLERLKSPFMPYYLRRNF